MIYMTLATSARWINWQIEKLYSKSNPTYHLVYFSLTSKAHIFVIYELFEDKNAIFLRLIKHLLLDSHCYHENFISGKNMESSRIMKF